MEISGICLSQFSSNIRGKDARGKSNIERHVEMRDDNEYSNILMVLDCSRTRVTPHACLNF